MIFVPGRTHIRSRSPRCTASSRWNNVGKGSRQIGSVTSGKGLALRAGSVGPWFEAGLGWARAERGPCLSVARCLRGGARRAGGFVSGGRAGGGARQEGGRQALTCRRLSPGARSLPGRVRPRAGLAPRGRRPLRPALSGSAGAEPGTSLRPSRGLPRLCGAPSGGVRVGRRLTADSELVRTRGIRLSN